MGISNNMVCRCRSGDSFYYGINLIEILVRPPLIRGCYSLVPAVDELCGGEGGGHDEEEERGVEQDVLGEDQCACLTHHHHPGQQGGHVGPGQFPHCQVGQGSHHQAQESTYLCVCVHACVCVFVHTHVCVCVCRYV